LLSSYDLVPNLRAFGEYSVVGAGRCLSNNNIIGIAGVLACAGSHRRTGRLVVAGIIAVCVYHMPVSLALMSAVNGAAFGLFPIGWIVLNAIFVYQLSVETGQFSVLQAQVAGLSGDRRIQALLVAFCFGAFIEGAAGFGAPVAITAGADDRAGISSFGSREVGTDWQHGAGRLWRAWDAVAHSGKGDRFGPCKHSRDGGPPTRAYVDHRSFLAGSRADGWRGMLGVWPACLVTGLSFGLTQF
jgi:lactate permease